MQAHSGSSANIAVYLSLLTPGDTVLGMSMDAGGHLTHGSKVNFSGKLFNAVSYGVTKDTHLIDYDEVLRIAKEHKPKMIIAGSSAYSRIIDFAKFREIADEVGAYLLVDMAHIAGLVAAGLHPNPVPYADVVTSTTHKTLRGQQQVVKNMQAMVEAFKANNIPVVSNGSDNHLCLIDTYSTYNATGHDASDLLSKAKITCNKNGIPFDTLPPMKTSGLRLGAAAMTSKGYVEEDFVEITNIICDLLKQGENYLEKAQERVAALVAKERKEFR